MIESRTLDGEIFIVSREGKQEALSTPAEATDTARARIGEHEAALRTLADQADTLSREVEHAAFFGEPTGELREALQDIQRQAARERSAIEGQRSRIEAIRAAVDRHQSERLAREHAGHLAALVAPFEQTLRECRV